MTLLGGFVGLDNMPSSEATAANIKHLAFLHQLFHRLPDFFPGRGTVNVMHLVEVNMIGLKTLEATLASAFDMQRGEPALVGPIAHAAVDFGGEDDFFAATSALRP